MPKPSLLKNCNGIIQPVPRGIREFMPYPKGINLKVNVKVQLEFEFASYDLTVQHLSDCALRGTPPLRFGLLSLLNGISNFEGYLMSKPSL